MHRFCQQDHVPCLFPNIDVPIVNDTDFYAAYFSRGVLLEADLFTDWLHGSGAAVAGKRVVQLYRSGDVGAAGAAALRQALRAAGVEATDRELPATARAGDVAGALKDLKGAATIVLWLRPADLRSLPTAAPAGAAVLVSGLMGGLEAAPLSAPWRAVAHLSYPVDLPERRVARMNFPYGWFKVQHVPLTAERIQINTYLACVVTAETVGHLFDSFVPEYLLERFEMMLSRRLANAYYPRLSLAPGQRFASKGGYIVHFDGGAAVSALPATADPGTSRGIKVIADTDWITP